MRNGFAIMKQGMVFFKKNCKQHELLYPTEYNYWLDNFKTDGLNGSKIRVQIKFNFFKHESQFKLTVTDLRLVKDKFQLTNFF